jgi:acetyl-CoA carboxylase, biotin carboxylase subunit
MMKRKTRKILVANRGEIAIRVMKTCRELGIKTVAVYSEADKTAQHVRYADEAFLIGPPEVSKSYLDQDAILKAATDSGADAIHPGYGFLSENAGFVRKVQEAGITFIGPDPDAIVRMGDKTAARKLAEGIGVPITPGTTTALSSAEEAGRISGSVGYPVLLKAAGGGGGKGMRIVRAESELESSLRASQGEARSAFGDDRVYIEKYIENPHHIEIQVLADRHGNAIHLGERECSVQRRHQKVVEESPSPFVTDDLRNRMTDSAIRLVRESGYVNAGTIEFIVDSERNFYFLEMNTRLQVEHPVTEMRTGVDLVAEQIRVAEGRPLSITQDQVKFNGHAIECRVYAEDPENSFYPSTGLIRHMRSPAGMGIREDRGVEEGDVISPFYDPMISKLVTWGRSREEAAGRMAAALDSYRIFGVRNNIRLCRWIVSHEVFRSGNYTTNFLNEHFHPEEMTEVTVAMREIAAVSAVLFSRKRQAVTGTPQARKSSSGWKRQGWGEGL